MGKSDDSGFCTGIDDSTIMEYVAMLKHGPSVTSAKRDVARILKAYVTLRRNLRTGDSTVKQKANLRNCDVMTTATALRKGWERRCEYGKPCCPFEYAMEEFE